MRHMVSSRLMILNGGTNNNIISMDISRKMTNFKCIPDGTTFGVLFIKDFFFLLADRCW